ncbi:MAG: fatty acyl-AMP ligase [Deltaproteobacteria bacterium]|nr:fatty acyl-AMP ligase [Deltaproteobacteria bacterium]
MNDRADTDRANWATVLHALRHWAAADPGGLAYSFVDHDLREMDRLTFLGLLARVQCIAAAVRDQTAVGDRVVLLFPQGLDFVAAFFGCLASGAIAVPTYPPRPNRPTDATAAVLADCEPAAVLTIGELAGPAERLAPGVSVIAVDALAHDGSADPGEVDPGTLAMLQYTSGSTTEPRGVMVTHANLAHNQRLMSVALGQLPGPAISWLPLYHDMGLIGHVLYPMWCGVPSYLMSPLDFLQRPALWLEAVSRFRGSIATGPNFAYDLCSRRVTDEQRTGLDLSSWVLALNGAEPVCCQTVHRFAEELAGSGFDSRSSLPCYGLAEATLFVSGGPRSEGAHLLHVDSARLEQNVISPRELDYERTRCLVGSGRTWPEQHVVIVDPQKGEPCENDVVGEIWISGPSVAAGYWNRPEESARTFEARLAGDDGNRRFLRTGDLGFVRDGQLFVTGRLVDLIIAMGRNHYPQDIERTVEICHRLLKPGRGAAFNARVGERDRLVVAHEVASRTLSEIDARDILDRMRQTIAEHHDLSLYEAALLAPGALPLTTSGKIRRNACRQAYLDETLELARREPA